MEARPRDAILGIWGIGLSADRNDAQHPQKWAGLNLTGFALMKARVELAEKSSGEITTLTRVSMQSIPTRFRGLL